jgi:hypothetical protein
MYSGKEHGVGSDVESRFEQASLSAMLKKEVPACMNRIGSFFFVLLLTSLQLLRAEKIDNRNFAIDTYYPNPNEIRLAEQRARKYWEKHSPGLDRTRFISLSKHRKYFRVKSRIFTRN